MESHLLFIIIFYSTVHSFNKNNTHRHTRCYAVVVVVVILCSNKSKTERDIRCFLWSFSPLWLADNWFFFFVCRLDRMLNNLLVLLEQIKEPIWKYCQKQHNISALNLHNQLKDICIGKRHKSNSFCYAYSYGSISLSFKRMKMIEWIQALGRSIVRLSHRSIRLNMLLSLFLFSNCFYGHSILVRLFIVEMIIITFVFRFLLPFFFSHDDNL